MPENTDLTAKMQGVRVPNPGDRISAEDGMVWVWGVAEEKWLRRHPIDAREQVALGHASWHAPDGQPPLPRHNRTVADDKAEREARDPNTHVKKAAAQRGKAAGS